MNTKITTAIICLLLLTSCAKSGSDVWEDMDYAKIAKENYHQENDTNYIPPTVVGCVDDDLYNCTEKTNFR